MSSHDRPSVPRAYPVPHEHLNTENIRVNIPPPQEHVHRQKIQQNECTILSLINPFQNIFGLFDRTSLSQSFPLSIFDPKNFKQYKYPYSVYL